MAQPLEPRPDQVNEKGQITDPAFLGKNRIRYGFGAFFDFFIYLGLGLNVPTAVIWNMGGGDQHIGLVGAAQGFFSLFQIFGPVVLKFVKSNRKSMLLIFGGLSVLLLLQAGAIATSFLFSSAAMALYAYIALFYLYNFLLGPKTNIEMSWAGDMVPANRLGWFNSVKWIFVNLGGLAGLFCIGRFADTFNSAKGFSVLYILLALFILMAIFSYSKVTDREPKNLSFFKTARGGRDKLALKSFPLWCYIGFYVIWAAGRSITWTFFAKFLMTDLHYNLTDIAWLSTLQIVVSCIVLYILGKVSDVKGSRFILILTSFFVACCMYLWVGTAWFGVVPVIIYQILNGAAGQTHAMLANNLALEIFPDKGRAFYLAFARFFIGGAGVIMPIIAGFALYTFPDMQFDLLGATLNRYHIAFACGATITMACVVPLILMGNRKVEV